MSKEKGGVENEVWWQNQFSGRLTLSSRANIDGTVILEKVGQRRISLSFTLSENPLVKTLSFFVCMCY